MSYTKNLIKIFLEYKDKRANFNLDDWSNRLVSIKKKNIENHKNLLKQAIQNLQKNNCEVVFLEDKNKLAQILDKYLKDTDKIVKSKSSVVKELKVEEYLKEKNITYSNTDLGDWLTEQLNEDDAHPVLPAIDLKKDYIKEKLSVLFKENFDNYSINDLVQFISEKIAKNIEEANVAITGANALTADGEIVILENEGNISKITRIPDFHIVFVGIEKIVENIHEAMDVVKCASMWGTGQNWPNYVNVIAGPSRTADIENELVIGAQGAKKVLVVLVDNGRSKMLKEFPDLWRCINCGACLNFCPVFYQKLNKFGKDYLGAKGVLWTYFLENFSVNSVVDAGIYDCTTCEACKLHCPAQIDLPEYIRKLRYLLIKEHKLETSSNKEMIDHVKEAGNPFGKMKDGEIPNKLYCC